MIFVLLGQEMEQLFEGKCGRKYKIVDILNLSPLEILYSF